MLSTFFFSIKKKQQQNKQTTPPPKAACQSLIKDLPFPVVFGWSKSFGGPSFIWTLLQKDMYLVPGK